MGALLRILLLAFLVAGPAAVPARDEDALRYDQVRLSASAGAEVDTDIVVAELYKEHQAPEQAEAASVVNRAVTAAVDRARAAGIEVRTAGYRTRPVYRDRQVVAWRAHQAIRLESRDAARLAALIGALQGDLSVQSLQDRLSPERRRETEERLIVEALEAFGARARLIARTLARTGYRVVRLEVHGDAGQRPVPVMAARTLAAESARVPPPAIEGGSERVEVRVEGSIELDPASP